MKRMMLNLADAMLSREQMKGIKGGVGCMYPGQQNCSTGGGGGSAANCKVDCTGGGFVECKKGSTCTTGDDYCESRDSNLIVVEKNTCPTVISR